MPDLAYILRHPIQEYRIARHGRANRPRGEIPWPPRWAARLFLGIYYANQGIGSRIANVRTPEGSHYADEVRPDLIGEDDRGDLVANVAGTDLWVPFRFWRLAHLRAAFKSRRTGLVNFLDLERA